MRIGHILIEGILFFFLFLIILALFNLPLFMSFLYRKIEITLYLVDGLSTSFSNELIGRINKIIPGSEIRYQSKEDALKELVSPNVIAILDKNPLSDTCKIRLSGRIEGEDFKRLKEALKRYQEIKKISYSEKGVDFLSRIKSILLNCSLLIGITYVFGIIIVLSIFSLIEVLLSKEEREILYLSGRTKWSLLISNLIFSMLDGLLGSILAISFLFLGYRAFMNNLFGFKIAFFSPDIILSLLGIGILIGFIIKIPSLFFI